MRTKYLLFLLLFAQTTFLNTKETTFNSLKEANSTRPLSDSELTKALSITKAAFKKVKTIKIFKGEYDSTNNTYTWHFYLIKKEGTNTWSHAWKAEVNKLEIGNGGFWDLKEKFLVNKKQYVGVWNNSGFKLEIRQGYNNSMSVRCVGGRWNKQQANARFKYENGVIVFYDPVWEKNNYFILQKDGTLQQTYNGLIDITKTLIFEKQ